MRKFKVINVSSNYYGLKIGDVVTLVEGSSEGDLYELPPRLHGKGHMASKYDPHLNLKEPNYVYIISPDLEEVKDDEDILIHSHKQEKLLNQIKEIIDREEDLSFSSMLEESNSYYEIKKLIKELENNEK